MPSDVSGYSKHNVKAKKGNILPLYLYTQKSVHYSDIDQYCICVRKFLEGDALQTSLVYNGDIRNATVRLTHYLKRGLAESSTVQLRIFKVRTSSLFVNLFEEINASIPKKFKVEFIVNFNLCRVKSKLRSLVYNPKTKSITRPHRSI